MAEADVSKHKEAYSTRKSESTRNPHSARSTATSRRLKDLASLCTEDRVLAQWRMSSGCPVSDEAKVQFQVQARGNTHRLADVRLWAEHHDPRSSKKVKDTGIIHLEFFFDGSPVDYQDDQEIFTKAFEQMIERQLQERRLVEFRQRFAARRRGGTSGPRNRGAAADDAGEGGGEDAIVEEDSDWKEYLKKPVPATNLIVRSLREAGCMLSFLVCQTSISVNGAEVLGQISFQEHFPIDGVLQDQPKSDKPMPRWAYGMMGCTAAMSVVTIFAWWQVMKQTLFTPPL